MSLNFTELSSNTLLGRAVRYPFKILPRSLAVPILTGQLRGKKWIVGAHRHACWLGSYETELQKVVAHEVKQGGVFYDVGANVGFYTLLASILVAPGKVFAFEPLPANICYIRNHLALNKVTNVDVLELAIADDVGTSSFWEEETRAMGRLQTSGNRLVQATTLDSLMHEGRITPPDYIKMDVEGAEYKALKGATQCFERYKPKLFLATHGNEIHEDCCRLLQAWDYEVHIIARSSLDRAEILAIPKS